MDERHSNQLGDPMQTSHKHYRLRTNFYLQNNKNSQKIFIVVYTSILLKNQMMHVHF